MTVVNALSYGALGDGTTDDTTALRAAIATGHSVALPTGRYKVTGLLTLGGGQAMFGEGRTKSVIVVEDDFDMDALGVIRMGTTEPGSTLLDIGIEFEQDSTETTRADIIQYPPAIYAVAAPRFTIDRVRISRAWDGIDATGNSGGAWIGDVEVGALNKGIVTSGALDFFHIGRFHFWPFGMSSGNIYESVYSDGSTIAAQFGATDGLDIGSLDSFRGRVVLTDEVGSSLDAFGTIASLKLDGKYARLEMAGGNLSIGTLYGTTNLQDDFVVKVTGGYLTVGPHWSSHGGTGSTAPVFEVQGGTVLFSNGIVRSQQPGHPIYQVSGGEMKLSSISFPAVANSTRTAPLIKQTGGVVSVTGVTAAAKGSGSGDLISIASDAAHVVVGNSLNGWGLTLPAAVLANYDTPSVEEFTPTFTFATPGDVSVSYTTQIGLLVREGDLVWYYIDILGTITHTTASGALRIAGLPLTLSAAATVPVSTWSNINLGSGFTSVAAELSPTGGFLNVTQAGDSVDAIFVTTAHVTTGSSVRIRLSARVLA